MPGKQHAKGPQNHTFYRVERKDGVCAFDPLPFSGSPSSVRALALAQAFVGSARCVARKTSTVWGVSDRIFEWPISSPPEDPWDPFVASGREPEAPPHRPGVDKRGSSCLSGGSWQEAGSPAAQPCWTPSSKDAAQGGCQAHVSIMCD